MIYALLNMPPKYFPYSLTVEMKNLLQVTQEDISQKESCIASLENQIDEIKK